jgi:hypothetical protein
MKQYLCRLRLRNLNLITVPRRLSDRVGESVPFNGQCFPFRFDSRIGRRAGSMLVLDGSQSECMALGVHTLIIHPFRL